MTAEASKGGIAEQQNLGVASADPFPTRGGQVFIAEKCLHLHLPFFFLDEIHLSSFRCDQGSSGPRSCQNGFCR
jgi:hypothetical protein